MANYLDTGDTGRAVSAESDGALLAGIFGSAKYVLENGSQLKAEVQSNNIVKISDGDAVMYGRHVRIPANDSALVTINNGHSGTNRIDLIVFRYTKDSTGKETVDLAVIQGEDSTGTATAPATIDGDILTGAMQADFPLYRVELNGLNIVSVTAMFDVIGNISQITKTNKELSNKLAELNDKINNRKNNVLIGKWGKTWNLSTTPKNIGSSKSIVDDDCYKTTTGANATVTIKQSGLYCVTMYAQGSASQGASACIQAQVIANRTIVDDNYVLFGAQYSYNGFPANLNMSRIIYLENGTVLSPQIRKSDASGAAATTGSSYMEMVKLA